MRLQLYVFVIRCIAYPFVAKQPTDLVKRQVKVNRITVTISKYERFYWFCISMKICLAMTPKRIFYLPSSKAEGLFLNNH